MSVQHWIRLELYPDLLLHRLAMSIDPADSSYMPSVVAVSVGDSVAQLKEIKSVHIASNDSLVTLLEDVTEVRTRTTTTTRQQQQDNNNKTTTRQQQQ